MIHSQMSFKTTKQLSSALFKGYDQQLHKQTPQGH
jgi:hypothetical protein